MYHMSKPSIIVWDRLAACWMSVRISDKIARWNIRPNIYLILPGFTAHQIHPQCGTRHPLYARWTRQEVGGGARLLVQLDEAAAYHLRCFHFGTIAIVKHSGRVSCFHFSVRFIYSVTFYIVWSTASVLISVVNALLMCSNCHAWRHHIIFIVSIPAHQCVLPLPLKCSCIFKLTTQISHVLV